MSERSPDGPALQSQPAERLDSWKEIAAFLGRDVRTVQRWEKQAGLPVHRHAESRLRTAYAYRSELEEWWRAQRNVVEDSPEPGTSAPQPLPSRRAPWWAVAAVAFSIAGSAFLAFFFAGWRAAPARPSSTITVLLSRFEGDAGDPGLAAVLQEHLARELEMHPGVDIVSPARLSRTLRLMKRSPTTPVTEAIGREIATRDGRVTYTIAGRIHSVGAGLMVDIVAIDPVDGSARLSFEWEGANGDQLLSRLRRRSQQLADQLIAHSPSESPSTPQLEPATTTSLAALRLYSAAVDAGRRRQWGASEMLARRAFQADEGFASAYAWTGWSMRQQGRPASECLPLLERAVALTAEISDRESYFVSGVFRTVAGDLFRAVAAFEALLRLQPTSPDAADLLLDAYTRSGRMKEAVDLAIARAEQGRDDFLANVRAAHGLAVTRRDVKRAMTFVQQAQQLSSGRASEERPFWSAWLTVFPVFQHWLAGDRRAALDMLRPIERGLAQRLGRERDAHAAALGFAHLAFGRRAEADAAFRYAATPLRQLNLAMMGLTNGEEDTARRWLSQIPEHAGVRPALFARVGLEAQALRGLDTLPLGERSPGIAAVTRGLIAANRGQAEVAAVALREGMDLLRFSGEPEYFFAAEALARLTRARGDRDRSLRLLSEAVAEPAHTFAPSQWSAGYWLRLNSQLAEMYRAAGRRDHADRIRDSLQNILGNDVAEQQIRYPTLKPVLPASAGR